MGGRRRIEQWPLGIGVPGRASLQKFGDVLWAAVRPASVDQMAHRHHVTGDALRANKERDTFSLLFSEGRGSHAKGK